MVKERFKELIDFATTESPYESANKGWITNDVYLQLGNSSDSVEKKNEFANISVLWNPIKKLTSSLFWVLVLSSLFVFISISFAKGRINLSIPVVENIAISPKEILLESDLNNSEILEDESSQGTILNFDNEDQELLTLENNNSNSEVDDSNGEKGLEEELLPLEMKDQLSEIEPQPQPQPKKSNFF